MEKKPFSLLRAINDAANGRQLDDCTMQVIAEGRAQAESAGVEIRGSILLPMETAKEKRFEDNPSGILASQNPGTEGFGGEAVPTELFDILGPLRDRLIVTKLGARMLSLSGNVEVPLYSGANCGWSSEIEDAQETAGTFQTVKLSPKRLTAILPISKQFLIQTSPSAEALLRQDLIDCVAEKMQKTLFSADSATDLKPAGLFEGVGADGAAFKFEDAVAMEELLESRNVFGEKKYVCSPATKALLRTTNIDKGSGRFVMENNEILGIPCESSSSVVPKGLILGNWANLYIGTFGALDLMVDPYMLAGKGQIRLVVNAYFDWVITRPEAFVKKILM